MALDGIAVAGIVSELNQKLLGGRIDKIYQPLSDEILFTVRSIGENFKVLVSANSNHPRIHITQKQKVSNLVENNIDVIGTAKNEVRSMCRNIFCTWK